MVYFFSITPKWGAEIEKDALFPKGINIEFVQKINSKEVRQRRVFTWKEAAVKLGLVEVEPVLFVLQAF